MAVLMMMPMLIKMKMMIVTTKIIIKEGDEDMVMMTMNDGHGDVGSVRNIPYCLILHSFCTFQFPKLDMRQLDDWPKIRGQTKTFGQKYISNIGNLHALKSKSLNI